MKSKEGIGCSKREHGSVRERFFQKVTFNKEGRELDVQKSGEAF